MLRWPREGRLWLLLSALAVLLGMLAVLQYRWVGEIGRAERDRLAAALDSSARGLAGDLERVAFSTVMALLMRPDDAFTDPVATCSSRLIAWKHRSEHPRIVSRLTLVARSASGTLAAATGKLSDEVCQTIAVPDALEPIVARLAGALDDPGPPRGAPRRLHDLILDDPPALLFPVFDTQGDVRMPQGPPGGPARLVGFLVASLDVTYLHTELLPALTESRFGPPGATTAAVAVVRAADGSVLYSSDPSAALSRPDRADRRFSLSPGLMERGVRRRGPGGTEPLPGRGPGIGFSVEGSPPGPPRLPDGGPPRFDGPTRGRMDAGWPALELVVRPRAATIDDAVAALRRRNLGISLGVLGLLGTAAVLLATGAQKARHLARQQLEFVAGVTHELNTPLSAIRSAGQNLADGIVTDPEQVRRYGALFGKESDRLGELVAQVLDFAGIESGVRRLDLARVALGPLVEEVVRDLAVVLERAGLVARTQVEENLPEVEADATALRQALGNLLTNAAKFAAHGGPVVVGARQATSGRRVELFVKDGGPGIPRAERERVFEPFVRLAMAQSGQIPGSGLGLSFVRHVAEAHGGRARIEGRGGDGTVVVMEIPVRASTGSAR